MLESGDWAKNRNTASALADKGLVRTTIKESPSGNKVEVLAGFSQEGEDVAGALRFTARVLRD